MRSTPLAVSQGFTKRALLGREFMAKEKKDVFICGVISIGNSMICSDISHKYHEWYFEILIRNLRQFWNITSGIYTKYHVQIMLLFVYTTTHKSFVIFTCRYFKLNWNTTALSQSNCRNFWCSSIKNKIYLKASKKQFECMDEEYRV